MPYKDPDKQREFQRRWMRQRREAFFADKWCVHCGSTARLELDHIFRGGKSDHRIWSWSEARRSAEIAKCQVLCYHCHKAKTKRHGDHSVSTPIFTLYLYEVYLVFRTAIRRTSLDITDNAA